MYSKLCIILVSASVALAHYAPPGDYPPPPPPSGGDYPPLPPSNGGYYPPPSNYPPNGGYPPEKPSLRVLMSGLISALVDVSGDKREFYQFFSNEFVYRINGVVSKKGADQCKLLRNPEHFIETLKDIKNPVDYLSGHGFTFETVAFNGRTVFVTVLAEKDYYKIVSFDEFKEYDYFGGY